jgi:hypothetical protein
MVAQTQAAMKDADEQVGFEAKPAAAAFEAPDAADLRGKHAWELDRWKDRT